MDEEFGGEKKQDEQKAKEIVLMGAGSQSKGKESEVVRDLKRLAREKKREETGKMLREGEIDAGKFIAINMSKSMIHRCSGN